ncbi:winged helix-turn-helix domain-containing protein [Paenibacillus lautus]|nr:winged helix-turn-helix domain-containing protein [Paenibacillus lautus]MEC0201709.1 winged helix-turn-helix domain-containing protein [Paenibacillus lautus]
MDCRLEVRFGPVYEFFNSLHTYICRKSHKKIDLSSSWAKETRSRLTPSFAAELDTMEVNADWKHAYLLALLSPDYHSLPKFLAWLEGLTIGDMFELMSECVTQFPANMGEFRSQLLSRLSLWNDQYFSSVNPRILSSLEAVAEERSAAALQMTAEAFMDETTNGMIFRETAALERIIFIPQYHFQPVNVISDYSSTLMCHYSSRIYLGEEENLPPHDLRIIRCLGEQSRLKILRYLQQGPRSFIEIVRYLRLSKGITHDHLSKLRSAGLIYAHFEGETLVYYSLRSKQLDEIHRTLKQYIQQN